eukprot:TRINITY_DN66366_c3_g3_i1.p1 TRINITY_DN66366_c3_g3~~TRINITY_DN66366_c3_g3_i1.p1  ORF type:complete len:416 (-),score=270.82 TRINITY_DN66366_c3_g3_i1:1700-2899(-)
MAKKGKKGGGAKGGKKGAKGSKSQQKFKEKVIEDKTFGLKNKNKSKKVQQYINGVKQQVNMMGKNHKQYQQELRAKQAKKLNKKAKAAKDAELASLFKAVASTGPRKKLDPNVDPKTVLCQFYKQGLCKRGNKCKFSHDLAIERKVTKLNVYADPRAKKGDTMEGWDQDKLESVVKEKYKKRPNETKIICKYFLKALEDRKYGYFWECPNGDGCIYKHALPPGYRLKTADDQTAVKTEERSIEEVIEEKRRLLDPQKCRPVTLESFTEWKKLQEKKREEAVQEKAKALSKKKKGKFNILSGRDLFTYDPTLFVDDDDAQEEYEYDEEADSKDNNDNDNSNDNSNSNDSDAAASNNAGGDASAPADDAAAAEQAAAAAAEVADESLFLDDDMDLPSDIDE